MSTTSNDPSQTAELLPLSVPCLGGREWEYVRECLDTGWVSSAGRFVSRFENAMAAATTTGHAVATVNGTAALHTALLVSGVQPGDEVITPTLTFIASANAIRYAAAWPVFIDAEPRHWQIDPELLERFLTRECEYRKGQLWNRHTKRRVRAIMPVHILGHAVEMQRVLQLARQFNLKVIEDAAQGLGTQYRGQAAGSFGDVGCFSFNGNKIATTGGGGVLVTNDEQLAARARYLTTQAKDDPHEYVHREIGYNYRLTNIQAALGCAQLEQLPRFVEAKRRIAKQYESLLSSLPGVYGFEAADEVRCTYWLYTVRIATNEFGMDCREIRDLLQRSGIQTRPLWQPLHASTAHQQSYALLSGVAERLFGECLSLPCSVTLEERQVQRVVRALRGFHGNRAVAAAA